MKTKRNLVFTVGAAVFAVLLAGAAVLLTRGLLRLARTEEELKTRLAELDRLYQHKPFPSPGNVQREKEHSEALGRWFRDLARLAAKGQVQPAARSPSNFMSLLGERRAQLSQLAASQSVTLAREFAFGFDRYFAAGSTLPAPEDVPRLTEQLLIIDQIATVLFEERIAELMEFEREEFEATASGAAKRRGGGGRPPLRGPAVANAGLMERDALYGRLRFGIELRAREQALLGVLNRLAAHGLFVVVTALHIEKEAPDVGEAPTRLRGEAGEAGEAPEAALAAEAPAAPPSRSQRVVAGREVETPMKVTLDLDVYRFREVK